MIVELNDLKKTGVLDKLVKGGVISTKIVSYMNIVNRYVVLKKKKKTTEAVIILCHEFNISQGVVYKAISLLLPEKGEQTNN